MSRIFLRALATLLGICGAGMLGGIMIVLVLALHFGAQLHNALLWAVFAFAAAMLVAAIVLWERGEPRDSSPGYDDPLAPFERGGE